MHQILEPAISEAVVGKAIKASPKEILSFWVSLPDSFKYPRNENTIKPQRKLTKELNRDMIKLSLITGLSLGL